MSALIKLKRESFLVRLMCCFAPAAISEMVSNPLLKSQSNQSIFCNKAKVIIKPSALSVEGKVSEINVS